MRRDARPVLRLVRWAVIAAVTALATFPLYVYVEPAWRPPLVRLAAALVLGLALLDLRRGLAERLEAGEPSALDHARAPRRPAVDVPLHFVDLMADVRTALRSRRFFDEVLWPRLAALAARPPAPPRPRRGRGPSLAALREVIAAIERQG